MYSLDWDKRYLEDEAALREAGGYDAADTQLLDPLPPGAPLWTDLPPAPVPSTDDPQLAPPDVTGVAASNPGRLHLSCVTSVPPHLPTAMVLSAVAMPEVFAASTTEQTRIKISSQLLTNCNTSSCGMLFVCMQHHRDVRPPCARDVLLTHIRQPQHTLCSAFDSPLRLLTSNSMCDSQSVGCRWGPRQQAGNPRTGCRPNHAEQLGVNDAGRPSFSRQAGAGGAGHAGGAQPGGHGAPTGWQVHTGSDAG